VPELCGLLTFTGLQLVRNNIWVTVILSDSRKFINYRHKINKLFCKPKMLKEESVLWDERRGVEISNTDHWLSTQCRKILGVCSVRGCPTEFRTSTTSGYT
jgi:hypothetical protein